MKVLLLGLFLCFIVLLSVSEGAHNGHQKEAKKLEFTTKSDHEEILRKIENREAPSTNERRSMKEMNQAYLQGINFLKYFDGKNEGKQRDDTVLGVDFEELRRNTKDFKKNFERFITLLVEKLLIILNEIKSSFNFVKDEEKNILFISLGKKNVSENDRTINDEVHTNTRKDPTKKLNLTETKDNAYLLNSMGSSKENKTVENVDLLDSLEDGSLGKENEKLKLNGETRIPKGKETNLTSSIAGDVGKDSKHETYNKRKDFAFGQDQATENTNMMMGVVGTTEEVKLQKVSDQKELHDINEERKSKVAIDKGSYKLENSRRTKRKSKMVIGEISEEERQNLREEIMNTKAQVEFFGSTWEMTPQSFFRTIEELKAALRKLQVDVEDRPT